MIIILVMDLAQERAVTDYCLGTIPSWLFSPTYMLLHFLEVIGSGCLSSHCRSPAGAKACGTTVAKN